jgi:hypothetical protein
MELKKTIGSSATFSLMEWAIVGLIPWIIWQEFLILNFNKF